MILAFLYSCNFILVQIAFGVGCFFALILLGKKGLISLSKTLTVTGDCCNWDEKQDCTCMLAISDRFWSTIFLSCFVLPAASMLWMQVEGWTLLSIKKLNGEDQLPSHLPRDQSDCHGTRQSRKQAAHGLHVKEIVWDRFFPFCLPPFFLSLYFCGRDSESMEGIPNWLTITEGTSHHCIAHTLQYHYCSSLIEELFQLFQ